LQLARTHFDIGSREFAPASLAARPGGRGRQRIWEDTTDLMISAVIPTHDGRELLDIVLASLATQTLLPDEVVVVDDASSDDTLAHLAERWPEVRVVAIAENVGVTVALNRCIESARGDLVLLLNNDVELAPDCIAELASALAAAPDAAVVAAKLRDYRQRDLLDGAGDGYSWAGVAYRRGQGEVDLGQYDVDLEVFGACAATALYRASALAAVGPFDEQFFALGEDTDWSFRARLAGYGCRLAPAAVAYHIGSASLGPRISKFTLYHNWRNQIWMIAKDYPASALAVHTPDLLLGQAANLLVAVRQRCVGTWLRAWRDALAGMPAVLRKRRAIQRTRQRGRHELEPFTDSAIARARWWLSGAGRRHAATVRRSPQDPPARP
jgi:GT2 family glycosyltransferase